MSMTDEEWLRKRVELLEHQRGLLIKHCIREDAPSSTWSALVREPEKDGVAWQICTTEHDAIGAVLRSAGIIEQWKEAGA